MHTKKKTYLDLFIAIIFIAALKPESLSASRAVSSVSGDWATASTWTFFGGISSASDADTVYIQSSHTITFTLIVNAPSVKFLRVFNGGKLSPWGNNSELLLSDSTMMLQLDSGAEIINLSGNNSNHKIQIGNQIVWGRSSCNNNTLPGPTQLTSATPCGGWASLPLHLLYFRSITLKGIIRIEWAVSDEVQMNEYVLKRSTDGINYEVIGTVKSNKQNSESVAEYSFIYHLRADERSSAGLFFKLESTDINGQLSTIGDLKASSTEGEPFVLVYTLEGVDVYVPESATVQLFNTGGQLVFESEASSDRPLFISNSVLPTGVLIVSIRMEGYPEVFRKILLSR